MRDKVVLITGGNTGIGKATALEFAQKGATVIITYLKRDAKILSKFPNGSAIQADITKQKDRDKIYKTIAKQYGHIDVLINNAAVMKHSQLKSLNEKDWEKTFRVNVFATYALTKTIAGMMKTGSIVNLASIRGVVGSEHDMDYSASKAAIINLTQSLAKELAPNIRVNAVSPGITNTSMVRDYKKSASVTAQKTCIGRMAEPAEIAKAIVFLAGDDASYVTGHNLVVDGGYCVRR